MKLLVLGGTRFLGRAIAAAALTRGHELTLFNRGQTNPELFPEAERLRGDRDGGLEPLAGRRWDARDLGDWIVRLGEERTAGVFNAIRTMTRGELLNACVRATGSKARLVWVPSERLLAAGVGEWMELPVWIASPDGAGMMRTDNRRALAAGLTFRPIEETVHATLAMAEPVEGVGLTPERERELLDG